MAVFNASTPLIYSVKCHFAKVQIEDARERTPTEPSNEVIYLTLRNGETVGVSADIVQLYGEESVLRHLELNAEKEQEFAEAAWILIRGSAYRDLIRKLADESPEEE